MASKLQRGLGRGLGALLGDETVAEPAAEAKETVKDLPLRLVDPNPNQPRRSFDEEALKELAASIKAVGVLQPILVTQNGERYSIIAGERRFRAARLAELEEIPAIVRDWDTQKRLEAALIENLQRDDLNPIEEAMGVQSFMEETGLTQERAAERLGKSRPAVANLLRLLQLAEPVRMMIVEGKLSAGHGRALVTLPKDRQIRLAELAVQQGWSVRQLERISALPVPEPGQKPKKRVAEGQLAELEGMARNMFGTRVKLDGNESKGKITLYYYNPDDLQRIWDVIDMSNKENDYADL